MTNPNFFIIGAPKCATTAISDHLVGHSSVFMLPGKEAHFFNDDLPGVREISNTSDYLGGFRSARNCESIVGEASVWYLYSQSAVKNIYRFNENAKILILIRNPLELVQSLHSQLLLTLDEDVEDFEAAWNLQAQRAQNLLAPKTCRDSRLLLYKDVAKFTPQILRAQSVFPKEQIRIIIHDDIVSDFGEVYGGLMEFLNIDDDGRHTLVHKNSRSEHRSRAIASIVERRPSPYISKIVKHVKRAAGAPDAPWRRRLRLLNRKKARARSISPKFEQVLKNEFREDIAALSNLLKRDLSHWVR